MSNSPCCGLMRDDSLDMTHMTVFAELGNLQFDAMLDNWRSMCTAPLRVSRDRASRAKDPRIDPAALRMMCRDNALQHPEGEGGPPRDAHRCAAKEYAVSRITMPRNICYVTTLQSYVTMLNYDAAATLHLLRHDAKLQCCGVIQKCQKYS